MDDLNELLRKIETENAEEILGEKDLVKKLNFLCQNGLVEIMQEKITLTEKGKEARIKGIDCPVQQIESTDFTELSSALEAGKKTTSNLFSKLKKKLLKR